MQLSAWALFLDFFPRPLPPEPVLSCPFLPLPLTYLPFPLFLILCLSSALLCIVFDVGVWSAMDANANMKVQLRNHAYGLTFSVYSNAK